MSDFDRTVFWPAFKAAGFLRPALVKQQGHAPVTVDVDYRQPSERRLDGQVVSQEHTIKYQHSDLPYLREGDVIEMLDEDGEVIRAERFKVREKTFVGDGVGATGDDVSGFFRHALLTRTP